MAKLIPTYSMPTADVRGAFAGYQSAMDNRGKSLDSLLDTVMTEVDTADKRAYTKSVSDVLASGDPRKMGTVDFSRLTPEAIQNLQQRMAMAEQAFKLDERDRLLNERKASDIYNEERAKGKRGLATYTDYIDPKLVEDISFTQEELDAMGVPRDRKPGETYAQPQPTAAYEALRPSIERKMAAQEALGKQAYEREVDYESELDLATRAVNRARSETGVVPQALMDRLDTLRAAEIEIDKTKRSELQKQIDTLEKRATKSALDAKKEQSRVANKGTSGTKSSGSTGSKINTAAFKQVLEFEGDMDKLGKMVTPFGVSLVPGFDASDMKKTGREIVNTEGFTPEDTLAGLAAGIEFGINNKFNPDAAKRAAVEAKIRREDAASKEKDADWAYRDAMEVDAEVARSQADKLRNRLETLGKSPEERRRAAVAIETSGIRDLLSKPLQSDSKVNEGAPKDSKGNSGGVGGKGTQPKVTTVDRDALIADNTRFNTLLNKENKSPRELDEMDALMKRLNIGMPTFSNSTNNRGPAPAAPVWEDPVEQGPTPGYQLMLNRAGQFLSDTGDIISPAVDMAKQTAITYRDMLVGKDYQGIRAGTAVANNTAAGMLQIAGSPYTAMKMFTDFMISGESKAGSSVFDRYAKAAYNTAVTELNKAGITNPTQQQVIMFVSDMLAPGVSAGEVRAARNILKPPTSLRAAVDLNPAIKNAPVVVGKNTTVSGGSREALVREMYAPIIQSAITKVGRGEKLGAEEIIRLTEVANRKSTDEATRKGIELILQRNSGKAVSTPSSNNASNRFNILYGIE